MFKREDWTLFRRVDTLGQKAGVATMRLPMLVAKELADNALDATGDCRVGLLDGNGFFVEDDGDEEGRGIPGTDAEVAVLFSINRPLTSSKLLRLPTRGALGNGLRVVAGAVLATEGSLVVTTGGRTLHLIPEYETGETRIEAVEPCERPGTRVEVRLGHPPLTVDERTLVWAQSAIRLAGHGTRYKGKTSPHWYDADSFLELLKAAGERTVVDVIAEFDGCAQPKAGKIAAALAFKGRMAKSLTRVDALRLFEAARAEARVVKWSRLGAVGPDVLALPPFHAKAGGTFESKAHRGGPRPGIPYVVEAWGEVTGRPSVSIHVNRTPIVADVKAHYDAKQKSLNLFGCGLSHAFEVGRKPLGIVLNVETPYMPITSDGKAPDLRPLLKPIRLVIDKIARRAKRNGASGARKAASTQKDAILGCLDEAIAKSGEKGTYRFSLRQLFYGVRPHFLMALGKEPVYDYFAKVITAYEAEAGRDVPGVYRDSRGTLYHPHSKETIALGTLAAEVYTRPAWTFNKILYCEKEGFFPILIDAGWPERHDCALMTSKGFASRAARDVLDLLGETEEELQFFCVHDADAAGTLIYQALQEGTRARPGRKVKIVNLGLDPEEALAMGLQVEAVKRDGKKTAPVAAYVPDEWKHWLQENRVELNAMTTAQFLGWLDRKMAPCLGKVLPPDDVLRERLDHDIRRSVRAAITAEILREARVDERVELAISDLEPSVRARAESIRDEVVAGLADQPTDSWTAPIGRIAESLIVPYDVTDAAAPLQEGSVGR
jgi:hypothetical protein